MAVPGRAGWQGGAVRIDGLTEAKATLAALPDAFRDVVVETIETGAAIIESEAIRRVPDSDEVANSGDLEQSIGTNIREDGLQAAVGSGLKYAPWVEFGTSFTSARPYLYPAFRFGARYVRKQMREWGAMAFKKVRFKTFRGKRANA